MLWPPALEWTLQQEGVTLIDSIVTAATARSKLWPALFGVLTVDHADYWGLDHWLRWISTVDHWLCEHLRKYTEECVVTPPLPWYTSWPVQSQPWLLSLWEKHPLVQERTKRNWSGPLSTLVGRHWCHACDHTPSLSSHTDRLQYVKN